MNIARLNMFHAPHDWVRRVVGRHPGGSRRPAQACWHYDGHPGAAIRTADLPTALDLQPGEEFVLTVRGAKSEELHSLDVNTRTSSTTSAWATWCCWTTARST